MVKIQKELVCKYLLALSIKIIYGDVIQNKDK